MTKDGWQDPEEKELRNPKDLKQSSGQQTVFKKIFKQMLIIVFLSAHTGKSVRVYISLSGKGKVPFKHFFEDPGSFQILQLGCMEEGVKATSSDVFFLPFTY